MYVAGWGGGAVGVRAEGKQLRAAGRRMVRSGGTAHNIPIPVLLNCRKSSTNSGCGCDVAGPSHGTTDVQVARRPHARRAMAGASVQHPPTLAVPPPAGRLELVPPGGGGERSDAAATRRVNIPLFSHTSRAPSASRPDGVSHKPPPPCCVAVEGRASAER
jgi:hypothetical protein